MPNGSASVGHQIVRLYDIGLYEEAYVDGPFEGELTSDLAVNYAEDRAGALARPHTENYSIESRIDYFEFGPDASNRVRIRNTETGASVTLSPEPGEETYSVKTFEFNANSALEDDRPWVGIRRAPSIEGNRSVTVNVSVTGDTDTFTERTVAPYEVQVLDESGTVLAETGTEVHGVGHPEPDLRYNGSAIAVERQPDIDEDWYVEFGQRGNITTEMTTDAGADYFVASVLYTGFDETENFSVSIAPNASADPGDRILALNSLELDDGDYVDGPVGGDDDDSSLSGPAAEYDADDDGEIDIDELNAAAQDFIADEIEIGDLIAVAQAYVRT